MVYKYWFSQLACKTRHTHAIHGTEQKPMHIKLLGIKYETCWPRKNTFAELEVVFRQSYDSQQRFFLHDQNVQQPHSTSEVPCCAVLCYGLLCYAACWHRGRLLAAATPQHIAAGRHSFDDDDDDTQPARTGDKPSHMLYASLNGITLLMPGMHDE